MDPPVDPALLNAGLATLSPRDGIEGPQLPVATGYRDATLNEGKPEDEVKQPKLFLKLKSQWVSLGRQPMDPPFAMSVRTYATPKSAAADSPMDGGKSMSAPSPAKRKLLVPPPAPTSPAARKKRRTSTLKPSFNIGAGNDSISMQAPTITRAGRRPKPRKHRDDDVTEEQWDAVVGIEPEESFQRDVEDGDTAYINHHALASTRADQFREPRYTEDQVMHDEPSTSQAFDTAALYPPENTFHPITFSKDIVLLYETLYHATYESGVVPDELPTILDGNDNEMRWTAKHLTYLYIYSYEQNEFNFCDLIADTWIRAFHKANHDVDKKGGNGTERPWLNKSLMYKNPELYRDRDAAEYDREYWKVREIKLDKTVTTIRAPNHTTAQKGKKKGQLQTDNNGSSLLECVNTLYHATSRTCPARLLWADMLALHGYPLSLKLTPPHHTSGSPKAKCSGDRVGHGLHRDLVWDIMSTSLRMVRCKVSLNCEEMVEGAWCKRYHIHTTLGEKCYRQLHKEQDARRAAEMEQHKAMTGQQWRDEEVAGAIADAFMDPDVDAEGESEEE
ncbi:hypothetical protein CC80DRAFT_554701 [Byssothecium circinans]|uniref:Uncharacterized protein n=1 Tax=Byssothecium circinans TaxID=147558 RepID=A0A6A5TAP4_9PLEO|nr:hypothetical protein CC80DRAFT_554701 [Byssothecium circinans]